MPVTPSAWRSRAADAAILCACIAGAGFFALLIGQDANWDLQNYHYYNPWAWSEGQRGYSRDVVAAQLQTYHNPLPDLPFYWMVRAGWDPKLIAVVLAVPAGIGAFFLWKLCAALFAGAPRGQRFALVAGAFTIGISSGLGFGVLATTMNEWPGTALTMAALYVLLGPLSRNGRIETRHLLLAGLLSGLATGWKFTFGVFAVGMCAGLLLREPRRRPRECFVQAFVFGLAVIAGTLVSAGPWMWSLWVHFQNPVFPYANVWIKSPWWGQYEVMGRPFGPHRLGEWLVFPFSIAAPKPFFVTEMAFVDGRIPVVYGLALAVGGAMLLARWSARFRDDALMAPVPPAFRLLGIFCLVSFLVWTAQFSILRYAVTLELLTGVCIAALLGRLVRPAARVVVLAMTTLVLIGTTTIPDWWRIDFGKTWFEVDLPKVDPNALVLLATDGPMSYVLPFFPDDASFLGIDNNISDARRKTLMEETIARRIALHRGPIYALSYPAGRGVDALLERGILKITETCQPIVTNMRTSPIEMCRVVRAADANRK